MPIFGWLLKALTGAGLIRALMWVFTAKGAAIVVRILGVMGLAFVTYEFLAGPVIDLADSYIGALPASVREWMAALGILEVMSIIVSAYSISFVSRVMLARRTT